MTVKHSSTIIGRNHAAKDMLIIKKVKNATACIRDTVAD